MSGENSCVIDDINKLSVKSVLPASTDFSILKPLNVI